VERRSLTDDLPITDLTWPYHEEDIKMTLNAAKSGSFKIAGDLDVHRLGYRTNIISSPNLRSLRGIIAQSKPTR